MKAPVLIALAALFVASHAQAQSTPIEQWQIIEGKGLTDSYVYLGMSRKEARRKAVNGECDPGGSPFLNKCSFSAQGRPDAPFLTLTFNDKSKVIRIDVETTYSSIKWPTTAGATDAMTADQVQALYPGSTLNAFSNGAQVVAARQGYEFNEQVNSSPDAPCFATVVHTIIKPKKRDQ